MQKLEWNIPATVWQGLNSRYPSGSGLVGPDEFTDGSINFTTAEIGSVLKRPGTNEYNTSALATVPRDQFEMVFNSGVRHLLAMSNGDLYYSAGDGAFSAVSTGADYTATANMEFASYRNRAYFGNGIDDNSVYDITTSYGGVTTVGPQVKDMGALVPATGPTAGTPTSGGSVPDGAHTYKVTYLYYGTEESNGSAASGTQTAGSGNKTIPITAIPVGGYGVTARKIYRDNADGVYTLVGTVSNNTATTFSDTVVLGTTPLPTDNNVPPKWSLIVAHRDRLWEAGVSDALSTLYYSEAGLPNINFTNNFIACSQRDPITGLAVYNDRVFVMNKGSFGFIQGTTSRDFRYIEVSPNIGCADNRSLQVVTIKGVPKLQWLSQLGIYQYDGSNLQLISDKIDNLLRFNIQQASGTKQSVTHSTQTDFEAGSETAGVSTSDVPGSVVMSGGTPTRSWDTQTEWEVYSGAGNLVTRDGTNSISVVPKREFTFAEGSTNGTVVGANLTLPTSTDFTGSTNSFSSNFIHWGNNANDGGLNAVAIPFKVPRSGTLNSITTTWNSGDGGINVGMHLYSNSGNNPGSLIVTSSTTYSGPSLSGSSFSFIQPLVGDTTYWAILYVTNPSAGRVITDTRIGSSGTYVHPSGLVVRRSVIGSPYSFGEYAEYAYLSFAFTSTAIAASGSWQSPTFDSKSIVYVPATVYHTATYPSGTSVVTTLVGSDDEDGLVNVVSQVSNSLNGNAVVSLANKRYWYLHIQLTTIDDRVTPTVNAPYLDTLSTGSWLSAVIDHTTDIVSLDALVVDSVVPIGTSTTVLIATSDDNITYTSYGAIGTATPKRYSLIQVQMTRTADHLTSPTVRSIRFDWTVTGTFTSSAVSTVTIPAGWNFFQASFSGSVAFYTRSATTSGGLSGASWTAVTNGATIPSTINIYVQYKAVLTTSASSVASVSSITLNWFTALLTGIRVTSMFYNKAYYIAAAEFSQSTNNIVLRYDEFGNWHRFNGLTINTMGLFFGAPIYGSATVGKFYRWLDPTVLTDSGTNIEMNLYTKEFEPVDMSKSQWPMGLIMSVKGTGCRYTPGYTVDGGTTWNTMTDIVTGLTYYDTINDNKDAMIRFVPTGTSVKVGYSLMFRVLNNDAYAAEIYGMRAQATVSNRPVLLR